MIRIFNSLRTTFLGGLFIIGSSTAAVISPCNIQETIDQLHIYEYSVCHIDTQALLDYLLDHLIARPCDQSVLIQLLQPCKSYPWKMYLETLEEILNGDQRKIFRKWLIDIDIPFVCLPNYIQYLSLHSFILRHSNFTDQEKLDQKIIDCLDALEKNSKLIELESCISSFVELESYISRSYQKTGLIQKVINLLDNHPTLSEKLITKESLDNFYSQANPAQKESLRELIKKIDVLQNIQPKLIDLLQKNYRIPHWAVDLHAWSNPKQTQSKPHFFENITATISELNRYPEQIRTALVSLYKKEQTERARGNYVFYHAQQWSRHLSADIYKQFWNIVYDDTVNDTFTFLRFENKKLKTIQYLLKLHNPREDSLFLNYALFGNANFLPASSLYYFTSNTNQSDNCFDIEYICNVYKLSRIYEKYKTEFEHLNTLHQDASSYGNMLLISIPENKLSYVHPTIADGTPWPIQIDGRSTLNMKLILDTLITNPSAVTQEGKLIKKTRTHDQFEFAMPLTTRYALDPHNGPRIYSFNAADPEKLKAYETARDALFSKIRQDIANAR